ncbi:MAG: T9SS type A sorting domain-containing protein [Bacteroidia bacterium]
MESLTLLPLKISLIKIIDITGKEYASSVASSTNNSIDLSNMAAGLYTLILNVNEETLRYKIQKN